MEAATHSFREVNEGLEHAKNCASASKELASMISANYDDAVQGLTSSFPCGAPVFHKRMHH